MSSVVLETALTNSYVTGVHLNTALAVSHISERHFDNCMFHLDRICGLVVRVLGYRSGGPGSTRHYQKEKVVGLERVPLSLVSTTEELLDRKVAAPV
jgi:hypothetical protein